MTNNYGARKRAGKGARTATCKFLKKSTGPNNSCNEVRNAQPSVEITRIVSKQYHHSWGKLKKPAPAALRNHVCVCVRGHRFYFYFFGGNLIRVWVRSAFFFKKKNTTKPAE